MKLTIDTTARTVTRELDGQLEEAPLYSRQAFEWLSREWVRVGWDQKYSYTFSWLGRPIIQLPEDMVRTQEVLHRVRPQCVIETGVAHGGSLVYYASLMKLLDGGRVIGVDIEIRPHNRAAIEAHPLSSAIDLIVGDSAAPETVARVAQLVPAGVPTLVILDSCHTKAHVAKELEAYYPFVTVGSYIVATDGIMQDVYDVPRGEPGWQDDHPSAAAIEFAARHPNFVLEQPPWLFNESDLRENITHWPQAWLRRVS